MKDVRDSGNVDESRFPGNTQRRRLGWWLLVLIGTCLAVTMAGASTMVSGGITSASSAGVLPPAPSDQCSGLSVQAVTSASCPGGPTLLIPKVGSSQVTLSWTKPASDNGSSIIGYNVYQGTSPGNEGGTAVRGCSLVPATGCTVTGLKNRTTYYFTVTAVNEVGEGQPSNEVPATPTATPPRRPIELAATARDGTVILSWTAPADHLPIMGYNVYQGTSPGGESGTPVNKSLVTITSYPVTGLTSGTTYYFMVSAFNRTGQGPTSNEAKATPAVTATVPGAPVRLAVTAGDGKVTLSWTGPRSDGGSRVTGYKVYVATSADFTGAEVHEVAGTALVLEGLVNGTTYHFRVTAVNGVGEGKPSNEVPATPIGVPGAPAGLTATAGDGKVTLTWAAPASDGGSAVTGYNAYYATSPNFTGATEVHAGAGTGLVVDRLVNGTTYYFRVTAVNRAGESGPSNTVKAVPVGAPGAPTGLAVTTGDGQVTLTWTAPASDGGSRVTGYNVYRGTSPGGESRVPVNASLVTATSYKVTGLVNATTYYFTVTAVNAVGHGPSSAEAKAVPVTVPQAPAGLAATAGPGQVTLSWTGPASDGGSPVTGYNVYVATSTDFKGATKVPGGTGTAMTVTGLVNGTTYYFRVTAVNRVGEGPASVKAKAVPATVPGSPVGLTATPGKSKATLAWAAPASGGSPITGYIIYKGTSPGGETGPAVNASLVNATSYTVTGLVNGTTYYFKVFAVNALGQGPSSEASITLPPIVPPTSPTPPTPPTPPASSVPPPTAPAFPGPTGLTATAGDTQVHLSWTAPASDGGSPITSYKVYLATTPGAVQSTTIVTAKGADATVTHLANGTTYYFMVTAVNVAGHESPFSTEVSAQPVKLATKVKISPDSPTIPPQLIALLTAAAATAAAGVFTLITRGRSRFRSRKLARSERSRQEMDVGSDVRAVPDTSRPGAVSVRDTGQELTHTVRLEPHPGVSTTTIKEERP